MPGDVKTQNNILNPADKAVIQAASIQILSNLVKSHDINSLESINELVNKSIDLSFLWYEKINQKFK